MKVALRSPDKNLFQQVAKTQLKSFEGIVLLNTLASSRPHIGGVRRISQQRYQGGRKHRDFSMPHENAGYAILYHIRRAAVCAANYRFGIRHRFQEYHAESFGAAGQRKHIAVGIAGEQCILREAVKKMNMIRDAGLACKLFESRPIFAITH